MTAPIIYTVHPVTGEYLGTSFADPDPLDADNWLVPSHAHLDAPPMAQAGHAVVRSDAGWSLQPDHRGKVYSTTTGAIQEHAELGPLPEGLTTLPPPSIDHSWSGSAWEFDPVLQETNRQALTTSLCQQIDATADTARRAVAGDSLRAVEYERSAAEAQTFKDAGYPAEAVPRTVSAWAINGRTAQQAADSILAEAAAYTEALYQIREARLGAKELVRAAMAAGNVEQAQDIAAETIAAIQAAVAGIGNNA